MTISFAFLVTPMPERELKERNENIFGVFVCSLFTSFLPSPLSPHTSATHYAVRTCAACIFTPLHSLSPVAAGHRDAGKKIRGVSVSHFVQ